MINQTNRLPKAKKLFPDAIFAFFLVFIMIFLLWKCRFGFGNRDEVFYLSVPFRLFQGDALFREEWNLAQMAGVLTFPFVSAYISLSGGTDGIVLAMRYFTILIQGLVALFIYIRLRPSTWLGSFCASISYLLFIPFGISALSYNSMAILFVVLTSLLMLKPNAKPNMQYYLAGLSFAAAVLCCPYLLLAFLVYLLTVAVRWAIRHILKTELDQSPWSIRSACLVSAGAATAAFCFFIFLLSRSSIMDILKSLEPILMSDPQHPPVQWITKTKLYVLHILRANPWSQTLYIILFVIGAAYILDFKRTQHKGIFTILVCISTLVLMYSHCHFNNYINQIMWSINVLGAFTFLFTDNANVRSIFYTVWIPGILLSYCVHMSSNQNIYAITSAGSVATIGSLAMIGLYTRELVQDIRGSHTQKLAFALICAVMICQLSSQALYRYKTVYWDSPIENLTCAITDGVEKGIYTTEEFYNNYYHDLACIQEIKARNPSKFLHLSRKNWYYFHIDAEIAAYSAWLAGVTETTLDRLSLYYQINPQKLPDLVFVDPEYEEIAQGFCHRFNYRAEPTSGGIILLPHE